MFQFGTSSSAAGKCVRDSFQRQPSSDNLASTSIAARTLSGPSPKAADVRASPQKKQNASQHKQSSRKSLEDQLASIKLSHWLQHMLENLPVYTEQLRYFHIVLPLQPESSSTTAAGSTSVRVPANKSNYIRLYFSGCEIFFGGSAGKPPNKDDVFKHLGCNRAKPEERSFQHLKSSKHYKNVVWVAVSSASDACAEDEEQECLLR